MRSKSIGFILLFSGFGFFLHVFQQRPLPSPSTQKRRRKQSSAGQNGLPTDVTFGFCVKNEGLPKCQRFMALTESK
jgi:hypothetical protein